MAGGVEEWDAAAGTFDAEPDHGLADPETRETWRAWLADLLPAPPAILLDLGCGTGSLSVLLTQQGYAVTGVDFSSRMLDLARSKADSADVPVEFIQGDANRLDLPLESFDAIVVRHVLWAMTDPASALRDWAARLRPGGKIVLIEGLWWSGVGIGSASCLELAREVLSDVRLLPMPDARFWGGEISDDRYTITGHR